MVLRIHVYMCCVGKHLLRLLKIVEDKTEVCDAQEAEAEARAHLNYLPM